MHHRETLRAVLRAAEQGRRVFPLVPGAKSPAIRAWESRATTDADRIAACWAAGDFNYGIATGPSRLVVVDLDVPKNADDVPSADAPAGVTDGADVLAALADAHGEPYPWATYTVRTVSGGTHLYFAAPSDVALRNTAGTLGWKIDTRAQGGYVVGPGSRVGGTPYTVVNDDPPAPLPNWLQKLLTPAPLPPQRPVEAPVFAADRRGTYLDAAFKGEVRRVERAQEGGRNNALYQAAVALGQLVAGGELSVAEVTESLTGAAVGRGLAESDARRTVASGLRAGARRPRSFGRIADGQPRKGAEAA